MYTVCCFLKTWPFQLSILPEMSVNPSNPTLNNYYWNCRLTIRMILSKWKILQDIQRNVKKKTGGGDKTQTNFAVFFVFFFVPQLHRHVISRRYVEHAATILKHGTCWLKCFVQVVPLVSYFHYYFSPNFKLVFNYSICCRCSPYDISYNTSCKLLLVNRVNQTAIRGWSLKTMKLKVPRIGICFVYNISYSFYILGKMKLIILGATGPSGQQVVALALAAGHDVTAVCRTPSKITTTHDKLKVGLPCYFMLIIITIMLEQTNQWVGKQPPPTYTKQ